MILYVIHVILSFMLYNNIIMFVCYIFIGGRRSPAVACWASDHWVASSNPLGGKFCH